MMPMNYYLRKNGTLAFRLDQAWQDYQNRAYETRDRRKALYFMTYVFDIQADIYDPSRLNKLLAALMKRRARKKDENPDYIPILRSGRYHLEHNASSLNQENSVECSAVSSDEDTSESNPLLAISQHIQQFDKMCQITQLSSEERARYNIEIYAGRFRSEGHLFNTQRFKSHGKAGFAAFTFNANGELSVFNHLGGAPDHKGKILMHSSMNASAPVLAAGEIVIQCGKLISINTYSGHYQPNLYTLALFLEYLSDRGISLKNTDIYLINPPHKKSGLTATPNYCLEPPRTWYVVRATDVIFSMKGIIHGNIESINDYLESRKTKQRLLSNQGTIRAKCALATEFKEQLEYIMHRAKHSFFLMEISVTISILQHIVTKYQIICETIGRKGRLDKKLSDMNRFLTQLEQELGQNIEQKDEEKIRGFQNSW